MDSLPHERAAQCDVLPEYKCSLNLTGRLLCKYEFVTPITQAFHRRWRRIQAELRGTTLLLFDANGLKEPSTEASDGIFRSYTLQLGDAGLAPDYKSRSDVFRVRVEGQQLLFVAPGRKAAMFWVESLLMAISISEPLETRKMPAYPSVPPRSRRSPLKTPTTSLGKLLWAELAICPRRRREWLLEGHYQSRKERWGMVVSGQCTEQTRLSFESFRHIVKPRSSSDDQDRSPAARCQCPSSACWGQEPLRASVRAEVEEVGKVDAHGNWWHSTPGEAMQCTRILTRCAKWNTTFFY